MILHPNPTATDVSIGITGITLVELAEGITRFSQPLTLLLQVTIGILTIIVLVKRIKNPHNK